MGGRRSCGVVGCGSIEKPGSGISFHEFPVNQVRREIWIQVITNEAGLLPGVNSEEKTPWSFVCSLHFDRETDYRGKLRKQLSFTAIPSVFKQRDTATPNDNKELDENQADCENNESVCNSPLRKRKKISFGNCSN